jgi:hypothetical protein
MEKTMTWLSGVDTNTYTKMFAICGAILVAMLCTINLIAGFWFGSAAAAATVVAFVLTPKNTSPSAVWAVAALVLTYLAPAGALFSAGLFASLHIARWVITNKTGS